MKVSELKLKLVKIREISLPKRLLFLIIVVIGQLFIINLYSQEAGGGYSEAYLFRNTGCRAISMAGAYTAIVNEPMGIFYNPAGLGFLDPVPLVNTSHSILEFNRTQSTVAWSQSFEELEGFGFGFGINNFTSGSFMSRNLRGDPLGEITDWHYSINAATAYRIEFASVGVAVKYLSSSLQGNGTAANGFAVDLGTKFNIFDLFSVGVAIQNISGMMFWNSENETVDLIPYSIRTGVAMEFGLNEESYTTRSTVSGEMESYFVPATRYVLLSLDAVMVQHENAPKVLLGLEVVPHEYVAFRGGMTIAGDYYNTFEFFPLNTWGAGVSVRPPLEEYDVELPFELNIDYSISSDKIAISKIAHSVSLFFKF